MYNAPTPCYERRRAIVDDGIKRRSHLSGVWGKRRICLRSAPPQYEALMKRESAKGQTYGRETRLGIGNRVMAYLLDAALLSLSWIISILLAWLLGGVGPVAVLLGLVLFIGYLIWWLIVLGRSQTPGKQIVGIQVVKDTGEPVGWGYMFLREFVVKFLLGGFLSGFAGIYFVVDHIWPLFDDDKQTIHDKMVSTLVVKKQ